MFLTNEQLESFKKNVIPKYRNIRSPLMQVLQEAQKEFGCVPVEMQKLISKELKESTAKINGVVTFYSMFSLTPKGKHVLGVCTGTACYVKGASRLVTDRCSVRRGVTRPLTSHEKLKRRFEVDDINIAPKRFRMNISGEMRLSM